MIRPRSRANPAVQDGQPSDGPTVTLSRMDRSLVAVIAGTFTLRFSTGLTGAMLVF